MSGVRNTAASIKSLNGLRSAIKALPLQVRATVAKEAETVLTTEVRADYDAGRTVYDDPRPTSKDKRHPGAALSLEKSGATRSDIGFVAIGTIVRAVLGRSYQKYLVGKYKILPQSLPATWREKLETIVRETVEDWAKLHGGAT